MSTQVVGTAVKRREDLPLVRGRGCYVDDIKLPRELTAVFVRSTYAHALIRSIDTSRAEQMPGVHAIYTIDQVRHLGPLLAQMQIGKMRPLLADGIVRHVGEAIAMVVADNRYVAQDIADAITVEYDVRTPVIDLDAAATDALKVHDDLPSNTINLIEGGDAAAFAAVRDRDDVVVVTQRLINQRVIPLALEPRAVLADWNTAKITFWTSTQMPFAIAGALSKIFGLPFSQVRVIAPDVGGAFGSKLNLYTEEVLVCFASGELARPVRWTETRREAMAATTHGRGWVATATLVATKQGDLLAYELVGLADMGAYSQCFTAGIPGLGQMAALGTYKIPVAHFKISCVMTHKMCTDSYRGAGRPEAIYCLERMVDLLARKLQMDPALLRLRNFWKTEEFPVTTAFGVQMDSGNYTALFQRLLENANIGALRQEQEQAKQEGRYLGIGLCAFVEPGGLAPSPISAWAGLSYSNYGLPSSLTEVATVRINPDASVSITTGSCSAGQGHETAWAQIASDALQLPMERITILHGDTQGNPLGIGSFGSRSAAVGGTAVFQAAERVRNKAATIVAGTYKTTPEQVCFADGGAYLESDQEKKLTWQEIAAKAYQPTQLPPGIEIGLEAVVFFDPSGIVWTYGAHLAVVEVDIETGAVHLLRYIGIDDCGNVINPMIVEGQIHGGIAQGFGQAMLEGVVYDEQGNLLTESLKSYRIPVAENLPSFEVERMQTPSPLNPLGVKGVGEGGSIAAPPVMVNATLDALAALGIQHLDMPLQPHTVWEAIHQAKGE
jgi:aerobic carbon-monoxide dehydrogenase large subunit